MSKWDNTPRTPQWAEDASGVEVANNTDPTTSKQYLGWVSGEGLVSATLNWLLGHHGTWLWFLNTLLGRFFDRDQLLRDGNANEGLITATYNGDGTWDLEMAADCYGWADGEAFLCEADTVTVDPTGTGGDSAWYVAVATKTGLAVRAGTDAASPTRPALSAGDVELFEIKLADGTTATSEQADLRHRGSYRGSLIVSESQFRAGSDGGGWLLEVDARSALTSVRMDADVVALDSANSTVVDGQSTTIRAAGDVTISSDGGGDVEISGRTVRTDARYILIPGQTLAPYGAAPNTSLTGWAFVEADGIRVDQSGFSGGETGTFRVPIYPPAGAEFDSFSIAATGAGATSEYTARLWRQEHAADNRQLMSVLTDTGSGDLTQTDGTIAVPTVEDDHGYYVEIQVPDVGAADDLTIHSVRIGYTKGEI